MNFVSYHQKKIINALVSFNTFPVNLYGRQLTICTYTSTWSWVYFQLYWGLLLLSCVIERNGKRSHAKNDHIEATSKENNYNKQCVNYFQSWHMGMTSNSIMETNSQQQATWSSHRYLSSHSGWKWPGIKPTPPSLPNHSRSALLVMI